jgi:hypothetical protein
MLFANIKNCLIACALLFLIGSVFHPFERGEAVTI